MIRAGLVISLVALLIAGCGSASKRSSSRVSATAYVTSLCQAVAPLEKDVATRSAALDSSASGTLAVDQSRLVGFLGALADDSSVAVNKLRAAGTPDVDHGSGFAQTILSTFVEVHTALARSHTRAVNLSTSSAASFSRGAEQLASAVKTSLGQLGRGLSTKANPALSQAAAKVSACHTL